MGSILGLDIGKHSFSAHLVCSGTGFAGNFTNDAQGFRKLARWIDQHAQEPVHACMEATSSYHCAVALFLHEAGHRVSVANPWSVKQFAKSLMQRAKTDPVDAKMLAQYCHATGPRAWVPRPEEIEALVALVRRQQSLKERKAALHNQVEDARLSQVEDSLERERAFVQAELEEIAEEIRRLIAAHDDLERQYELLVSIPGIGKGVAPILLAELGDVNRFDNPRQVAAYAGLTPQPHESGSSVHKDAKLTALGNRHLRRAMFMPAVVVFRTRKVFGKLTQRLLDERRHKKIILAALMRKLLHLAYGVLRSGRPYDPEHRPVRGEPDLCRAQPAPC